ncbi:MAG: DNA damage-inducible protein D [Robiginitomaculum sp.]|nr:DNA damage-inducible protein D [Robiginitomaculum sp.]
MTDKKNYDEKFSLNMPLDEALGRFAQTKPDEMRTVLNEDMPDDTIDSLIHAFESNSKTDPEGNEFWFARDLQELFQYSKWENFQRVLNQAMIACTKSGQQVPEHWLPDVRKSISGKGREDEILEYKMSRYACYLTAQNADSKKAPIAFAQTYFAVQTRRQELADKAQKVPDTEDGKRVVLRNQIKEHNKYLSSAAKGAGVITSLDFAIFHSHGYQGLYGKTVPEIRHHRGLAKSANILDRMGSTELAANFFRVTQTEEKLIKDNVKGKDSANKLHYDVGRQVRDAMLRISGIAPEDLPVVDSIKKAETRVVKARTIDVSPKAKTKASLPPAKTSQTSTQIDLRKDLWKYALLVLIQQPNMEMSTTDLIAELPNYIQIPDGAERENESRGDSKFSQIVRNLKSHKTTKTNFIYQGYAEGIPRGFRATEKGRQFVLEFFSDRI